MDTRSFIRYRVAQDVHCTGTVAADNGMTTNDLAARYDDAALENQRAALLATLAEGQAEPNALYLFLI